LLVLEVELLLGELVIPAALPAASDDALCVLVPILEEIVGWDPLRIRGSMLGLEAGRPESE